MTEKDIFDAFDHIVVSWDIKKKCLEPLTYLVEDDREITVIVDLPCVKKENINVYLAEDVLTIEAKMEKSYRFNRWGTIQKEIVFNSFQKIIKLDKRITLENVKTKFSNGILEVRLIKKTKKRKIEVD